MTIRQWLLNLFYPVIMKLGKARAKKFANTKEIRPVQPFYSLSTFVPKGQVIHFEELRGKKILVVNTASDCGYTAQYQELQELYDAYRQKLYILAFPSNDFGQQEKGSDEEIIQFCKDNFGVSFPVAAKSAVKKGTQQNPVFEWLSHKERNGWNEQAPSWNFCKYLINEKGVLMHYFDPSISPLDKEIIDAIEQ